MATKENCDLWIDYVYDNWLEKWIRENPSNSFLRESTKNMVERMNKALSPGEAWNLMERLKRLSDSFYNVEEAKEQKYLYERAEVYMECARVAYKMGDIQEALNLLRVSSDGFSRRSLYKAMSYWLSGCIQWQIPSHSENAVLSWERGMQIISEVGFDRSTSDATTKKKCEEVTETMRSTIDKATRDGSPPPPPHMATDVKAKPVSPRLHYARLKFLPYFGKIPAGKPVVVDDNSSMVDVDDLKIEGHSYRIFDVRGKEREIFMNPSYRYFLAKVGGYSMNATEPINIDYEDYVLLKDIRHPESHDIVAAIIIGEEPEATLKRYIIRGGDIFLRYENENNQTEVPLNGKNYYIQGVVVAVLKSQ